MYGNCENKTLEVARDVKDDLIIQKGNQVLILLKVKENE